MQPWYQQYVATAPIKNLSSPIPGGILELYTFDQNATRNIEKRCISARRSSWNF